MDFRALAVEEALGEGGDCEEDEHEHQPHEEGLGSFAPVRGGEARCDEEEKQAWEEDSDRVEEPCEWKEQHLKETRAAVVQLTADALVEVIPFLKAHLKY